VTGIVALSQAAVGFGVGLLIADKFDQTARQRTAVALIGAGAATILPFLAGIIANINNRPDSPGAFAAACQHSREHRSIEWT
jgi:uncharacterized membrane protein